MGLICWELLLARTGGHIYIFWLAILFFRSFILSILFANSLLVMCKGTLMDSGKESGVGGGGGDVGGGHGRKQKHNYNDDDKNNNTSAIKSELE